MSTMRNCPRCNNTAVIEDGYCGHCRESTLAPVACSAPTKPRDQQWLQEICELVKNKMPASHTFVVFAFPIGGTDRCYYASNAERESSIAALKEWIACQQKVDSWMKHDDGPPPPAPWTWS